MIQALILLQESLDLWAYLQSVQREPYHTPPQRKSLLLEAQLCLCQSHLHWHKRIWSGLLYFKAKGSMSVFEAPQTGQDITFESVKTDVSEGERGTSPRMACKWRSMGNNGE
jgi:hypothetical protein